MTSPHPSRAARGHGVAGLGRRALAGAGAAGRTGGRGARTAYRGVRALTHAGGAGPAGLARLVELHLVATFADTLILTSLASTIFFSVATETARARVATSLLVTMVPFAVLAPVLGPLLDRVRRGRRYALATTMVVRAFLAWVMAGSVSGPTDASIGLYLAAFGFLVCQKAYLVTRAAALPRVLPARFTLVAANSRISLAGVAAMTLGAPVGAGLTAWVGPQWALRLAFVVFAAGTVPALALSPRVDSSEGEVEARLSTDPHPLTPRSPAAARSPAARAPRRWSTGPRIVLGLRANATFRAFTGFLTLYLAFRLRTHPLAGLSPTFSVALVIAVAGVGGALGTALGSVLRRLRPDAVVLVLLLLTAAAAFWAALGYSLAPVLVVAGVAGLAQGLGKLCLDALIQREVPEDVRTSAFARSETVLQLSWVLGGGLGLVLPLSGPWAMAVAAVLTLAMAGVTGAALRRA